MWQHWENWEIQKIKMVWLRPQTRDMRRRGSVLLLLLLLLLEGPGGGGRGRGSEWQGMRVCVMWWMGKVQRDKIRDQKNWICLDTVSRMSLEVFGVRSDACDVALSLFLYGVLSPSPFVCSFVCVFVSLFVDCLLGGEIIERIVILDNSVHLYYRCIALS